MPSGTRLLYFFFREGGILDQRTYGGLPTACVNPVLGTLERRKSPVTIQLRAQVAAVL